MPEISKYPPVSVREFIEGTCKLAGDEITLYPYQMEVLESDSKFRIVCKARQIGFSALIAMEALYKAVWYPNKTILFVSTGDRASRRLMEKFREMLDSMQPFTMRAELPDGKRITATNRLMEDTKREVTFKNGSRVVSLPNNPDGIRGYQATDVYLDEFAFFENPKDIWTAILPSLTRGQTITIVSTPAGKLGEYWKIWDEADPERSDRNGFTRFSFPYSKIKSQLSQKMVDQIEILRKNMSQMQFDQEYECQFVDEAISMFPYELIKPCIDDKLPKVTSLKTSNPIYMGIDFGVERNSTVVVFLEKTEDGWRVLEPIKEFIGAKRMEKITGKHVEGDFEPIKIYIEEMLKTVRPTRVFIDANGMGERLNNELRRVYGGLVQPIKATKEIKERLIISLRILFENQSIKIPKNDLLISQLHELRKDVTEGGNVRYKHASGKFDDAVWALCYALTPSTKPVSKPIIRAIRRY